jgi:hypothetical protein
MAIFGFNSKRKSKISWPEISGGEMVPPVFFRHIHGGPLDMELTLNLLEAYGIPTVCRYPNNGLFGKLIVGYPPGGMDVFVPETLLNDARDIFSAEANFLELDDETREEHDE